MSSSILLISAATNSCESDFTSASEILATIQKWDLAGGDNPPTLKIGFTDFQYFVFDLCSHCAVGPKPPFFKSLRPPILYTKLFSSLRRYLLSLKRA